MIQFKEMPSKSQLKIFLADRMKHINKTPKIRIIQYNKNVCIYEVTTIGDRMQFCPTYSRVQSVNFARCQTIYTIDNNIFGYGSILSEIEFFNRNPNDAIKRNLTLIKLK
jgi:hypothetical protein